MRWERFAKHLLDIAIVVVLVGFVATFLVLSDEQHRDDHAAGEIATWAQDHGVTRVAWPVTRRGAAPGLRSRGVTPVLYDPSTAAAQNAAVNHTPIVVTDDPADLDRMDLEAQDSLDVSGLRATLVDLRAAAGTTIEAGQSVGQEIARPYVYAPIADSAPVTVERPFFRDMLLSPGTYEVEVAVFDPIESGVIDPTPAAARVMLFSAGGVPLLHDAVLQPLVVAPIRRHFSVSAPNAGWTRLQVELLVPPDDTGRTTAYLHEWSLERES